MRAKAAAKLQLPQCPSRTFHPNPNSSKVNNNNTSKVNNNDKVNNNNSNSKVNNNNNTNNNNTTTTNNNDDDDGTVCPHCSCSYLPKTVGLVAKQGSRSSNTVI